MRKLARSAAVPFLLASLILAGTTLVPETCAGDEKQNKYLIHRIKAGKVVGSAAYVPAVPGSQAPRTLLTGSESVKAWNIDTGQEFYSFDAHDGGVAYRLAVSPDGRWAASAGLFGDVAVYDLTHRRIAFRIATEEDGANFLGFGKDPTRLYVAWRDRHISTWDVEHAEELDRYTHDRWFRSVAISPDEKTWFIALSTREFGRVLDRVTPGRSIPSTELTPLAELPDTMAVSPDGRLLALGTNPETIQFLGSANGKPVRLMPRAIQGPSSRVAFTPNGRALVLVGPKSDVRVVELAKPEVARQMSVGGVGEARDLVIAPDAQSVAVLHEQGAVLVWDISLGLDGFFDAQHSARVASLTAHAKHNWLLSASADGTARIWDAETGENLQTLDGGKARINVAIASTDGERVLTGDHEGKVRLWDVSHGRRLGEFVSHATAIHAAAISRDRSMCVTAAGTLELGGEPTRRIVPRDCSAKLWRFDAEGQAILCVQFDGHQGPVIGTAFIDDESKLATASQDGTVCIWDIETGEELLRLDRHAADITAFAIAPDQSRIFTIDLSGESWLWHWKDGAAYRNFDVWRTFSPLGGPIGRAGPARWPIRGAAFSPDGSRLALGSDGGATIFDLKTGERFVRLGEINAQVDGVAWSSDGKHVYTGSSDKRIRRWGLPAGVK